MLLCNSKILLCNNKMLLCISKIFLCKTKNVLFSKVTTPSSCLAKHVFLKNVVIHENHCSMVCATVNLKT
jgi:hypothetical protein